MIINDAKDLEAAPSDVRELFVERLADGINRWSWENGEWMLGQNTAEIEQFGFTLNDFPDAPIPDKPDYNPDELQFSYREDLAAAPTVAYRVGTDNDGAVADTDGFSSLFSNPVATLDDNNANQARIRLHDITEATSGYIGHGAQIDVTASDYASKQSAFTITLRLGHGAPNVDDTNGGTGTANVVTDPILNAIGVFGTLNVPMTTTEADANFSTGSNTLGTAVE
jgi:hypothetical protein